MSEVQKDSTPSFVCATVYSGDKKMSLRLLRAFALVSILPMVGGCLPQSVKGWPYRNGPDPVMPYAAVKPHLDNQVRIMNAFESNVIRYGGDQSGSKIWYYTALEGYNFVDGECDQYMDELYALDHGRDRFKSAVDSTGLLVNAIMATDPSSKVAMSIVAQAFGLASKYVDTFANSYLYSGHSSTVHHVVSEMQAAYRSKVVPSAITSEPEAYQSIRGYLELCLPPTIEAKIDEALSASKASTPPKGSDTGKAAAAAAPLVTLTAPQVAE
ncbi:hypothetical protein [Mesorhizobium carmichaelinearum]|uniref:hypothetical protein n=1 Tax=Mesorhizobium carmichaelinearum TaxID=1208188 RepID=UPI001180E62A|nr:hypothetical protein [Mesorhizobium carmichaelinearum]